MELYDSLTRWNLWGSWHPKPSVNRIMTSQIYSYIDTEEVIALIGPRRAGKSTILYQLMTQLIQQGVDPKAILHINFEEPGLSPYLKPALLDQIYEEYRSHVYPKGKAYIFLDEIQNVPEWERWVRARNDLEEIKIFITGSSAALLSGELATALSGRNFCFRIYPLSFKEVLAFKKIELPNKPYPNTPPAEIHFALNEYLQWGGFPRIVLAQSNEEKEQLLRRYFDEIIFKDIVQRYKIRNMLALKNIAIHVLTNTSTLVTYKRLADIFEVSQDLAQTYLGYLSEAFIINLLPYYSLKASERVRHPMKVHALDLGLRKVVSLSASVDASKLIETQVHNTLVRIQNNQLFYWKNSGEIDVLTQNGTTVTGLYQVAYAGLGQNNIIEREMGGLTKALQTFSQAKPYLVTMLANKFVEQKKYSHITVLPLWHFLIEDF